MESALSFFVHHPLRILAVAACFVLAMRRFGGAGARPALMAGAIAWALAAAWEFVVMTWSPGANIRVDLLVIFPVLALVSLWALVAVARRA